MDRTGIDVQAVSRSCPNIYFVDGPDAVWLARSMKDRFAAAGREHPDRLKGLVNLPLTARMPEALNEMDVPSAKRRKILGETARHISRL